MEVILQQNVKGLGQKYDLVQVRAGYGRNYLIPQGYAQLATPSLKKVWQENQKQREHKREYDLTAAQQLAEELSTLKLEIVTKASEKGNIYGSITPTQVSESLKAKGHFISREKISFKEHIKTLGEHHATIQLHKNVEQDVALFVVEDKK